MFIPVRRSIRRIAPAACAAALFALTPATAEENQAAPEAETAETTAATTGARDFTAALIGDLRAVATEPDLSDAERDARVEDTLMQALSVQAMSMFVLGLENWNTASEEQIDRYLELFPTYISRVFAAKIGLLADRQIDIQSVRERATPSAMKRILAESYQRATGETLSPDAPQLASLSMVMSKVIGSDGQPKADVQWLIELSNEDPRVFDVVAEGASSLIVEREKIRSIAKNDGLDALLTAMEEQIADASDT